MRKVHLQVTMDVLVYADDDCSLLTEFVESDIDINCSNKMDVQSVDIENVKVTDSR